MLSPEKYALTHHCCQCNRVQLASGAWLKAVFVSMVGIKEPHGFCPECLDWQFRRLRRARSLKGVQKNE